LLLFRRGKKKITLLRGGGGGGNDVFFGERKYFSLFSENEFILIEPSRIASV